MAVDVGPVLDRVPDRCDHCKRLQPSPSPRPDRPTLDDVARAAEVSTATVSRALRRPELVNDATRQRVLAAVDRLGYRPHAGARSLAGGRTDALAVVVPDVANPFFASVVRAVQSAAAVEGAVTLLGDSRHDPDLELDLVARLADRADAVVACSSVAPAVRLQRAAGGRPLVLVNRWCSGLASVVVDQAAVVHLALGHLAGLGHRRLAWVAGPGRLWSTSQRRRALGAAATGLDVAVVEVGSGAATAADGDPAADGALAAGATGIVAFNDLQALAVIAALRRRGVAVPEDVSVVGADDVDAAAVVDPPLTTVAAPTADLGHLAVALARDALDGAAPAARTLAPTLVVRRSSGPASH